MAVVSAADRVTDRPAAEAALAAAVPAEEVPSAVAEALADTVLSAAAAEEAPSEAAEASAAAVRLVAAADAAVAAEDAEHIKRKPDVSETIRPVVCFIGEDPKDGRECLR